MIRLGANTVLFGKHDLETAMKHIAMAGYDGVEISAIKGMCEHLDLDNYRVDVPRIRKLSREYGLGLLAMEVASLDPDRLEHAFEAAALLEIPVVNIGPGGKADSEEDWKRQIPLIDRMAERARIHGVSLCCKAHVGASIYSTETTLRALKEIRSEGFGVDMDPSHIVRAGEDPVAALGKVVHRARHIHIRDCPTTQPGPPGKPEEQTCGRGRVNLVGFVKLLVDSGYDGPVDLEIIGAGEYDLEKVITIAAESRGHLQACLQAAGAR